MACNIINIISLMSVLTCRLEEERAKYLVCELVSSLPEGLQDIAQFLR
jgi:hypothetical protein